MWQRLKILRTWNLHPSRGGNLNTNNFFAGSHLRHFWSRHPGHCLTIKGSIEHLPKLLQVAPVFLSGTRLVLPLGVICLVMDYLDSSKTELRACNKTRKTSKWTTWRKLYMGSRWLLRSETLNKQIIQNENLKSKVVYLEIEIFVWVCGRVRVSGIPFHKRIIKMRILVRTMG